MKVEIIGRVAEECAGYFSLDGDMHLVQFYLDRMRPADVAIRSIPAALQNKALWSAAVLMYTRAFTDGKRKAYAKAVPIPAEFGDLHADLMLYRNKTLAHVDRERPVNYYVRVVAELPDRDDRPINVYPQEWEGTPGDDKVSRLRELATTLNQEYERRTSLALHRIQAVVKQTGDRELRALAERERPLRVDEW